MATHAIYNWDPATAPVNLSFVQRATFHGSGFPARLHDQAFVTTSGPTWASGAPKLKGKRIIRFVLGDQGELQSGPTNFIEYGGSGRASAAALAAGPDGLYFSDLYKDDGSSPLDTGANILRVRYSGHAGSDGTAVSEHLFGTPRNDTISGGGGHDLLAGKAGADRLLGGAGRDILLGDAGNDQLVGGAGPDRLVAGGARDRIRGGGGNDVVLVRDGFVDTVSCGGGRDRAVADAFDTVASDCERRLAG
jgi:hypothetical protein